MEVVIQSVPVSAITSESHRPIARPSANFHPSVWGKYFLAYDSEVKENFSEEEGILQQLKEDIRKLLTETPDEFPGKLDLIDNIQRLGVSYHFESEIEASLHNIYMLMNGNVLYTIALRFRLLRQQGFEEELIKEGKSEKVNYFKFEMKKLARAYIQEAKWFHNGYVPKFEEYMKVALVRGAFMMLATTLILGMGDVVTTQSFEWVTNEPLIVRATSVVCRLMDDMAGHESEQERGHVASAVECYMNEYGASKQKAYDEFQKRVTNAWKDINGECLRSNAVPMEILQRVVNLAKMIHLLYQGDDGYTHSATKTKDLITSLP